MSLRVNMSRARWAQWILVPLVMLLIAEAAGHAALARHTEWYEQDHPRAVNFVFVGSSRVHAAFDSSVFDRTYRNATGKYASAWNVGAGNSTVAAHYLGIRNFLHARGGGSGLTAFIELDNGIPSTLFAGTWAESWVRDDAPYVVARHMRQRDVRPFLKSDTSLANKVNILTRYELRSSSLISYRDGWQSTFNDEGASALRRALVRAGAPRQKGSAAARGINSDPLAIAHEAMLKRRNASKMLSVGVDDWDGQILADLVQMLQRAGSKVVFVELPLSSVARARLRGDRFERDRAGLSNAMKRWGTPVIDPAIETTDNDFPDLDHLAAPAARRYSAALANTYAATVATP